MRRRATTLLALSLAVAACADVACWPARARAYEDQYTLGVGLGYAHAFPAAAPHPGALAELSASLGLDPTWTARARITGAWHPSEHALYRALAGAELLYMIDILELVPSFGLGLDAVVTRLPATAADDDAELRADFAVHAVVGIDYLLSRELSLAFDARPYLLATALRGTSKEPLYLTISASLVWVFDQ